MRSSLTHARSVCALVVSLALPVGSALGATADLRSLTRLSLEELGEIKVTTVSRQEETLLSAPASIYVITGDDIRRSGASSLPEALRLAPNLQVARVDANNYAITARGQNAALANKLLVMIDGRTIYTPLFSGVFWEAQDVLLEDVERIEVVSGPGATLWGTNAVNGVISIVTRQAGDTQGVLATATAGTDRIAGIRYGGRLGEDGHFRIYGKVSDRPNTGRENGAPVRDSSGFGQGGFRADWEAGARKITLQGGAYAAGVEQALGTRRDSGANLLARWSERTASGADVKAQVYYDRSVRDQPRALIDRVSTFDAEFQYGWRPAASHRLLLGAGYRQARDRVENVAPATLAFLPASRNLSWLSLFAEDKIALREALNLTLGMKFERNVYTGFESMPSVRLDWTPRENRFVWGAISRAVRAPSRVDRDLFAPAAPPFLLAGGTGFRAETANVLELGYRSQPSRVFSYSATAFHHDFRRIRSLEATPGGLVIDNQIEGTLTGVEGWTSYQVTHAWRLKAGMTRQQGRFHRRPGSADTTGLAAVNNDPHYWFTLRSAHNFASDKELDLMLRRIAGLPGLAVAAYTALDARLAWRVRPGLELSLTAQNLFDPRHAEFGAAGTRSELERGLFLKAMWQP